MISYDQWKIIIEDDELDVRLDPQEIEGYGLNVRETEKYLLFPRGTLKELANANRQRGKGIIERWLPVHQREGEFFRGTDLNYDSIRAIVIQAYLKEEEEYREHLSKNL